MTMTAEELRALVAEETAKNKGVTPKDLEDIKAALDGKFQEYMKPGSLKALIAAETKNAEGDPKGGFKSFGEFAQKVAHAEKWRKGYVGTPVDKRLIPDTETKDVGSPSTHETPADEGGYLVPTEFRAQLLDLIVEKSNILSLGFPIPMATNSINVPFVQGMDHSGGQLFGGVYMQWLEEETQFTGARPKFGQVALRLKKLAGLAYISSEMIEDSPISIEPILTRNFTDALAWQLDWAFLNGSGGGQPQGILNSAALITVAIETGQTLANGPLLYENIVKMYSRMWNKANGVFFANHELFPALASLSLVIGTAGAPAYLPANSQLSGKPFDTLMGKPLIYTEHCRALGTTGDLIFADFSQYLMGQKAAGALLTSSSVHLKFDYDQMTYRFIFRIDGQSWWPSALTPRYGSATLSPFVALGTRS